MVTFHCGRWSLKTEIILCSASLFTNFRSKTLASGYRSNLITSPTVRHHDHFTTAPAFGVIECTRKLLEYSKATGICKTRHEPKNLRLEERKKKELNKLLELHHPRSKLPACGHYLTHIPAKVDHEVSSERTHSLHSNSETDPSRGGEDSKTILKKAISENK